MNISIRKMRVFLAAIEKKSFTKAALAENISQPATTIIISQIEEEFRCALFIRRGAVRSAAPTPAGEEVAETFSRIVAHYDCELEGVSAVSTGHRRKSRILIQTSYDMFLDSDWLETIVEHFLSNDLSVEVMPREVIIRQVADRDATIGLIDGGVDSESVDFTAIGDFKLVHVTPTQTSGSQFSAQLDVSMSDLPDTVLAFTDFSPVLKRQVMKKIAAMNEDVPRLITINSLSTLVSLMKKHRYTALVPDALLGFLQSKMDCRISNFKDVSFGSQFGLITPWGHLSRLPLAIMRPSTCFQTIAPPNSEGLIEHHHL